MQDRQGSFSLEGNHVLRFHKDKGLQYRPLPIRLGSVVDRVGAHAELISSMLLLHVAQYQLDRLRSRLQWDDGFRHMASMPGARC